MPLTSWPVWQNGMPQSMHRAPCLRVEFLEIATSQVGLYYENELLRRQLRTTVSASANGSGTTQE
jgi:hypothetical protein